MNNQYSNPSREYLFQTEYRDFINLSSKRTKASLSNYGKGYSHLPTIETKYTLF